MSIIKVLDPKLANMIAAGEVVDRPASVIKELVENSIDAKATSIIVEVFDMGMKSIVVTDDGMGMDKNDAHLSFMRHATSKISDEIDLSHIHTLGFRGEALAAISSVSKISLKTRQKDSTGIEVIYHGGHFVEEKSTSLNVGTVITVNELFYNTPARFKYIKSDFAEKQAIIDIFDRLALANPKIRMKLIMDDKVTKETYGNGDFYLLIDQIYGSQVTKDMIIVHETIQKMHLSCFLISPQITRSKRKDISVFVNGRYIKNYALTQAVIDGYHSYLMVNKYPIAFIHIEMDPQLIDVNVHPQKYEVKFVNESLLAYSLTLLIQKGLNQKSHPIPEQNIIKNSKEIETYVQPSFTFEETKLIVQEQDAIKKEHPKIPDFDYVGIFAGTYVLFQNQDGLYLMDQHAAMERIRYEHYYQALGNPQKTLKNLIVSYQPTLTHHDFLVIKEHVDQFKDVGFHFNEHLELISIPTWLRDEEIELSLETMVSMISDQKKVDLSILRDHLAKDISCKGSIRANKHINRKEIDHLVNQLRQCENPYTCPHGRPTLIKLSHYEIERMFKRVV
ncbi:MAG: DNA mismatch repair endonuclease MutL [Acholeplasmataceae bacterium]|jgi:DNA mismatch repair protein MutL|nr:DNA mismatch repair endonuclease MutL [Acholeplasmataceae bacterium]